MNKTVKGMTAILLSALILCSAVVLMSVSAATQKSAVGANSGTTGSCTWTLDDDGTLTISGNGGMAGLGEYHSGVPDWGREITSVVFEYGVTSIGGRCFNKCTQLKSVSFPNSVKYIYSEAFYFCKGLTSVTIPDSMEEILASAFLCCTELKQVYIPESVTYIGSKAFGYNYDKKLDGFTIYGKRGSKAEDYAKNNGFKFVAVNNRPTEPSTVPATTQAPTTQPATEMTTAEPTTEPTTAATSTEPTAEPETAPTLEVMVGDVNNDGTVNGADAGVLSRFAAGWKGYEDKIKNMAAADINGDGNVNGADAGILARYTSGWKQYDKYFES